jgi:hypothetical protein
VYRSQFADFFVAHHVGDYLLQTEFQAQHKEGGLGGHDAAARRALMGHGLAYTAAFVPSLFGVARRSGVARALGVGALIMLPHLAIDDGRLVEVFMRRVKGTAADEDPAFTQKVDQTMHMVCLWVAARVAEPAR